jgi:hypothetical protein
MARVLPPLSAENLGDTRFVLELESFIDKLMQENQVLENKISVLERKLREARYSGGARQDEVGRVS